MPDNDYMTPATDAIKALHRFLLGSEDGETLPPDVTQSELQRSGIDINKMAAEIRKKISQAQNRVRLSEIAARAKDAVTAFPSAVVGTAEDLRSQVLQMIESLSATKPEAALVFHRKLEESTPEDLVSLLADLKDLQSAAEEEQKGG